MDKKNKELINKKYISTGELTIICNYENKSNVAYYKKFGLITPAMIVGGINLYETKKTLAVIKKIQKLKEEGKKLNEIKKIIFKK